jgi:carnitine 3-dehydrogenase
MSKAAIIGGGVIGGGWAARFALMGWDVAVFDPAPGAQARLREVYDSAARALPMLYDRALPAAGTLRMADSLEDAVAGATWIQESVPERLALKHAVIASIEAACAEDGIIGSSTSGFRPAQVQEGAVRPERIVVAHPFNPVYLLPLVELVPGAATVAERAEAILRDIGMVPLRVRAEIDAHIADRLLESVWREALWLVRDGIATTAEIDDAIRLGFGLRWAQMGLFETYRIAGGEAGMRHFLAQFGPALAWPWTRLTEVPDLDDALIDTIAQQSDAQAQGASIRDLERRRDDNLVAILRALKARSAAAGAALTAHEATLPIPDTGTVPMVTVARSVPVDWTDMNDHMNEGRYGQVFSDAAEAVMAAVGADQAYVDAGHSYFTVETVVKYLSETRAGEGITVATRITEGSGKKLRCFHEMRRTADGVLLATCDQLMLHVSLKTRRSCPPLPHVAKALSALAARHAQETP